MLANGLILIGGLWLLVIVCNNYLFPLVKKFWPSAIPTVVETTVAKVDDYADMVAGIAACFTITAIAKKRGNVELAQKVADVRVTLAKLSDDSVEVK